MSPLDTAPSSVAAVLHVLGFHSGHEVATSECVSARPAEGSVMPWKAGCNRVPQACTRMAAAAAAAAVQERNTGGFNPELDEELEDAQGNVYSRKVYEDLKRQGLL